ncbi:MAG TPA: hypothetical protein VNB06_16280 [Thermoanaerobaculia bacterium]|nr:hypothetical protein [Thermoanaerobaculia bacterium]
MSSRRVLAILFRVIGAMLLLAILAVFLPTDWMASIHAALGLGEMPRGPLVEYLTRSVSALYAFHGALFLLLSTDLRRYRPVALFMGVGDIVFGLTIFGVGLYAGLPAFWVWSEGPPTALVGTLIVWLARRIEVAPRASG